MNKFERYSLLYEELSNTKYSILYKAYKVNPTVPIDKYIQLMRSGTPAHRCKEMICHACNQSMLDKWFRDSISTTDFWGRHSAAINARAKLVCDAETTITNKAYTEKSYNTEMLHQRDHVLQFMQYQKRTDYHDWDNKDGGYSDGETIVSKDWKCGRYGCKGIVGQ